MRITIVIFILLFSFGCSVTTQIIEPDGSIYIIESKSDAMVSMKSGDREYTIDNRGKPNIFESLLGWLLIETPDVVNVE